jgi:hypothetical protein
LGNETPWQMALLPGGSTARGAAFPVVTAGNNMALGYLAIFIIPFSVTMTTGVTFYLMTTDDGSFSADLGNTCRFGITVKKVTASNTLFPGGAEQKVTVTNAATSGQLVQTPLAVANANLNTAGPGDTVMVRFRRIGGDPLELTMGRVLVPSIHVKNT